MFDEEVAQLDGAIAAEVQRGKDLRASFDRFARQLGEPATGRLTRRWQEIRGTVLIGYRLDEAGSRSTWGFPFEVSTRNLRHAAHAPTGTPQVNQWITPQQLLEDGHRHFGGNLGKLSGGILAAAYLANAEQLAESAPDASEKWWLRRLLLERKLVTAPGLPVRLP